MVESENNIMPKAPKTFMVEVSPNGDKWSTYTIIVANAETFADAENAAIEKGIVPDDITNISCSDLEIISPMPFSEFEDTMAIQDFSEALNRLRNLSEEEKKKLNESIKKECEKGEKPEEVEEGLLGGVVGGIAGLAFGPKIGDAICKALGITKGTLYDLLHSRIFTAAVCSYLGVKA